MTCAHCTNPIRHRLRVRTRRYCSRACAEAAKYRRHALAVKIRRAA